MVSDAKQIGLDLEGLRFGWRRNSRGAMRTAYGQRYAGDPKWIVCRYVGTCKRCGKTIKKGERAFRYKDRSLYCDSDGCGQHESRAFEAAAFDEYVYNQGN